MAVSDSRLQFLLARSDTFTSRVQMKLTTIAARILEEQGAGETHAARAEYARQVLQSPGSVAAAASIYLAQSTNVRGTITMEDEGVRASVEDAALESQINSDWDLLARIDSGN